MFKVVSPLISLILCGSAAFSATLNGVYDASAAACQQEVSDSRVELSGGTIMFWESTCDLTNAVEIRGMSSAMLYDFQCYGEGEEWSYRAMLGGNQYGDLIIYVDGGLSTYVRCGK